MPNFDIIWKRGKPKVFSLETAKTEPYKLVVNLAIYLCVTWLHMRFCQKYIIIHHHIHDPHVFLKLRLWAVYVTLLY